MKTVFIDGQEGTTGLGIQERLAARGDLTLLEISRENRKDPATKRTVMAEADVVILCLPDAAALEMASLAEGLGTRIIDASTAHRTAPGWTYGLPELTPDQRQEIQTARFVANPGCYPTGFLLAARPLVDAGVLAPDYPVTVHAQSGFSGGGKKLIQAFAEHDHGGASPDWAVRPYALTFAHKHVPEMQTFAKLSRRPIFCPEVGNYYQGMLVSVPLHGDLLSRRVRPVDVRAILTERYSREKFVRVVPEGAGEGLHDGYLSPTACNGTNVVELFVFGNDEQILVVARLDNLGKGASGAAVQNLNLMLGLDESSGLD